MNIALFTTIDLPLPSYNKQKKQPINGLLYFLNQFLVAQFLSIETKLQYSRYLNSIGNCAQAQDAHNDCKQSLKTLQANFDTLLALSKYDVAKSAKVLGAITAQVDDELSSIDGDKMVDESLSDWLTPSPFEFALNEISEFIAQVLFEFNETSSILKSTPHDIGYYYATPFSFTTQSLPLHETFSALTKRISTRNQIPTFRERITPYPEEDLENTRHLLLKIREHRQSPAALHAILEAAGQLCLVWQACMTSNEPSIIQQNINDGFFSLAEQCRKVNESLLQKQLLNTNKLLNLQSNSNLHLLEINPDAIALVNTIIDEASHILATFDFGAYSIIKNRYIDNFENPIFVQYFLNRVIEHPMFTTSVLEIKIILKHLIIILIYYKKESIFCNLF